MTIDKSLLILAVKDSYKHHNKQDDVREFKKHEEANIDALFRALVDGTWRKYISFRPGNVTNNNGKRRKLSIPSLRTRMLEHYFLLVLIPLYQEANRGIGVARNCQPEHGITAKRKEYSVLHELKHLYYDLRELRVVLTVDQRQCYAHVTVKIYRKAMKYMLRRLGMGIDKELIDFGEAVSFPDGASLPIGTPASPWIHHIVMLESDIFIRCNTEWCLRYADDNIMAFRDSHSANVMKWRIANLWWYEYGIRMKRQSVRIIDIDKSTMDFCSFIVHRNPGKKATDNDKGYTVVRRSILRRAKMSEEKSWPSYFGILKCADCYRIINKIQEKMPKCSELVARIRIDREMDAKNISMKDLEGVSHNVYQYKILKDKNGNANWIKAIVGIPEVNKETGEATGRMLAREYHGNYQGIIQWFLKLETAYPNRSFLPIEDGRIINQCGFIYEGSTNQMEYVS